MMKPNKTGTMNCLICSSNCAKESAGRLDLMHHVFKICLQGDTAYTKLQDPTNILDVGTGTGIWAIEMGVRGLGCPFELPY